jgi:hypothetical protein
MTNNNGNSPELTRSQLDALDMVKDLSPELARAVEATYKAVLHGPEEPPADPWKAYSLADAYQERPPVEYITGKLFELPSLNIVYGAPGTMKSFLMQDLATCAMAGLDWLMPAPWQPGRAERGYTTRQTPAIWLDFDNGKNRTLNRFEALGRGRNLPENSPITIYSMPNPWLYADKPESIGTLAGRIKERAARLVIIDNLGNVSGDADENSAEMGKVMSHFRQLAEDTGAAIVLIHHQRKGNGTDGRAGDTLRGHSSIEAALDLALKVEREAYSSTINVSATKVRGADVLPFSAAFTYESKDSSDELRTARFFGLAGEDNSSDTAIEKAIIETLQVNGPLNKTKLKTEVKKTLEKVGPNRIGDIIDRAVSLKKIKVSVGAVTNEKVYSL